MKLSRLTAAAIAAMTAITPLSFHSSVLFTPLSVSAVDAGAVAALPDWIPNDFDSAADFRNLYGATHIENGLICVVASLRWDKVAEGEPQGMLRYEIQTTDSSLKMLRHTSFSHENSSYYFEVAVFDPQQAGDFDIAVIDTWAKDTDPDLQFGHAVSRYSFSAEDDMNITETDIFSWLPDGKDEYSRYLSEFGEVSVRDNYVVFCTMTVDQFGDKWEPDSNNQYENIQYLLSSDCTMQAPDLWDDSSVDVIYVYQAVKDGCEKLSWVRTSDYRPDQQEPTPYILTADCAILDDAQTVLLVNTARIQFINADTGELIDLPTGSEAFQFALNIAYKTDQQGVYAYVDTEDMFADRNPYIWDFSEYSDADILSIDVLYSSVRKYYWFPDGYKKQVIYDNGARDIIINLKPNQDGLQQDTVRFTFVDADTGKPLQITENTDAYLFEASMSYLDNGEPMRIMNEHFTINPNPYIWDIQLQASAGVKLTKLNSFYLYANALPEGCELNKDDIRKTVYDYNAMDVIVPLKLTLKGDVNRDGVFNGADAALLQKWLLAVPETSLADWKAADFSSDNKLTSVDLSMMKQELLRNQKPAYVEPDEQIYGAELYVVSHNLKLYLGPDESYSVAADVPYATKLQEMGWKKDNDRWIFTEYNGNKGWIMLREEDGTRTVDYLAEPAKPVIYLYPEQETDVHVELELTECELNTTYPKYDNGWVVTAYPDGTLVNKADGSHHRYLFWDAKNCSTRLDFSKGFCVAGCDTERFLKEKLTYMGLTEEEMNEFIVYWLPLMEHNAYNLIAFQGEAYTNSAKLTVTPAPDSECRVFMAYVPLAEPVEIEPQQLKTFERRGFAVVEWGGVKIRS